MIEGDNWKFHARKMLIKSVMKEVDISKDLNKVYLDVFYAVSNCGLHMKAKKEGLFDQELWWEREKLEVVIIRIKEFLWKEIK